ncbi:protein kinase [Streptomyces sp. MBT61]|uniref:protein kinase n=1 Tax=Streptomyces sp. MBT61 TaxID=1488392 RepID=UPI0035A9176C
MDDYAGRVLADRYRLPLPPSDGYELAETRAFDTYSGQEVLVRQVPLPEIVDAEVLDADGRPPMSGRSGGRAVRRSTDPAVRRAIEAAQAAAQVPDHPRLDQVFDVFAEADSLWIVSELVAARPLAALLAERPLTPYRAAEIGSDVLTALRVLHAHGWTHRNITVRTVLVCDDGRVMLTGLAAGAAEEALCGYAPEPLPDADPVAGPAASGPTTYGIPAPDPPIPPRRGSSAAAPTRFRRPGATRTFRSTRTSRSTPTFRITRTSTPITAAARVGSCPFRHCRRGTRRAGTTTGTPRTTCRRAARPTPSRSSGPTGRRSSRDPPPPPSPTPPYRPPPSRAPRVPPSCGPPGSAGGGTAV